MERLQRQEGVEEQEGKSKSRSRVECLKQEEECKSGRGGKCKSRRKSAITRRVGVRQQE